MKKIALFILTLMLAFSSLSIAQNPIKKGNRYLSTVGNTPYTFETTISTLDTSVSTATDTSALITLGNTTNVILAVKHFVIGADADTAMSIWRFVPADADGNVISRIGLPTVNDTLIAGNEYVAGDTALWVYKDITSQVNKFEQGWFLHTGYTTDDSMTVQSKVIVKN